MKITVDFTRRPTEKMVSFAESLSEEVPFNMGDRVYEDFDECSRFIDKCLEFIDGISEE